MGHGKSSFICSCMSTFNGKWTPSCIMGSSKSTVTTSFSKVDLFDIFQSLKIEKPENYLNFIDTFGCRFS